MLRGNGREYIARQGGEFWEDKATGLVFHSDDVECKNPLGDWQYVQAELSRQERAARQQEQAAQQQQHAAQQEQETPSGAMAGLNLGEEQMDDGRDIDVPTQRQGDVWSRLVAACLTAGANDMNSGVSFFRLRALYGPDEWKRLPATDIQAATWERRMWYYEREVERIACDEPLADA